MVTDKPTDPSRRLFLQGGIAAAGLVLTSGVLATPSTGGIITRAIPSSAEPIPVIGMGTSRTFNVGSDPRALAVRTQVLKTFLEMGGGMVDSSPMYGSAEKVLGHCLKSIDKHDGLFSATKVWTWDPAEGPAQVGESQRLWGVERFDLNQVHNLVGWEEHLPMLFELKRSGRLRYVGITTSHGRQHGELEHLMRTQPIDFVQLSYNIADREAEQRLLPLAQERGIAVICNRPFRRGDLIDDLEDKPLPPWAAEIDCSNWPQFLLKFIVSHPAVTCAIPATSRVDHMRENMGANRGELPDPATRQHMVDYLRQL